MQTIFRASVNYLLVFCSTVCLFCVKSNGQQLVGRVLLQNSGKEPVAGVQIKSDGANPDISRQDGGFQLRYINRSGGSAVSLTLEKVNLEVVNEKEIVGHRLRNNYADDPFYIFMCPKGELARRRAEYYDINERNINKRYEEELAKLQKQNKNTRDALAELDDRRKAAMAQADALAERLAITNLDFCTDIYRQAIALVEQGNITAALNLLDDALLRGNVTKVEKELAEAQLLKEQSAAKRNAALKNKKQAIDNLMLKADLYAVNLQFDEAERVYRRAIGADTLNYANMASFAAFLSQQNKHNESIEWNKKVYTLSPDNDQKIESITAQADSYAALLDYKSQEKILQDAWYYLNNSINDLESQAKYLIPLKIKLASSYANQRRYLKAIEAYDDILKYIQSPFYRRENKVSIQVVLYMNLSDIERLQGQYKEAEKKILYALELFNEIEKAETNTKKDNITKHVILNNIALLYSDLNDFTKAEYFYKQALDLIEPLAKKNPFAYQPLLALVLMNLGNVYVEMGDLDKSELYCNESIVVSKKMVERNPKPNLARLAGANINLGQVYYRKGENAKAELAFNEAIKIYKEITEFNYQAAAMNLAVCYNDLGAFYADINEEDKAEIVLLKALEIYKIYDTKYFLTPYYYQALTYLTLGNIQSKRKQYNLADSSFTKSIKSLQSILNDNTAKYEPLMATVEYKFAILYWDQGDIGKAAPHFTNALHIYRKYREKDPNTYDYPNALACINLARIHQYVYESKGRNPVSKNYALSLLEEALSCLKTYPTDRTDVKDLLAFCINLKKDLTNK